jgi:hypothetical protein
MHKALTLRLIWITSLFVTLSLYFSVTAARAQETAGLSLSPPTFELSANPGDNLSNTIKVVNLSPFTLKIATDKRNFTAVGEDGAVSLTGDETLYSLASWITVSPDTAVIPTSGYKIFTVTTKVPWNAEPGGHFGSVIFRTIPDNTLAGSGATLSQELGDIILLKVAGDVKNDTEIASFGPIKPFFETGPVEFDLRVKNNGSVHVKPVGSVVIADMFGHKVASIPLNAENVLPGSIRKMTAVWNTKWLVGRYTATVAFTYDTSGKQVAATTIFTVFPVKLALGVLIVVLILSYLLYRSRQRLGLAWKILTSGKA